MSDVLLKSHAHYLCPLIVSRQKWICIQWKHILFVSLHHSFIHSFMISERKSINHTDHHDVPDGGDDGDPQPDGVTGHALLLFVLCRCWGWGRSVHAGRWVKQRVFSAAVICVHERSAHHWKLKHNTHKTRQKIQNIHKTMWETSGCCYVLLLRPFTVW